MEQALSVAYHPKMDGQTECINTFLEQFLRDYVDHQQSNCLYLLPFSEYSYNNLVHGSTGQSFKIAQGFEGKPVPGPGSLDKVSDGDLKAECVVLFNYGKW